MTWFEQPGFEQPGFDRTVLDAVVDERTDWLVDAFTLITHTGGTVAAWIVSAVVTIALILRGHRRAAILVSGSMLSGWLLLVLLKEGFARRRPPLPERLVDISTYSFPSGHAMMTAVLACVLASVTATFAISRGAKVTAFVVLGFYSLVVGLSRVYLAAHWMSDVLAGWACGTLWALMWVVAVARIRPIREISPSGRASVL